MLKYKGGGFVIGIPARDLTKKELEALGVETDALVRTGLYTNVADEAKEAPVKKVAEPQDENKRLVNDEGDLR